jgi:hypothetical protein
MTTHFYTTIENLTVDMVWEEAQRHMSWSDGNSYLPTAYAILSEADNFAYDCWTYLNYLKHSKEHNVNPRTPEQWCEHLIPDTPERVEKKKLHLKLLEGVAKKFNDQETTELPETTDPGLC